MSIQDLAIKAEHDRDFYLVRAISYLRRYVKNSLKYRAIIALLISSHKEGKV